MATAVTPIITPEEDRDLIRSKNRGSRVYNVLGEQYPSVTAIVGAGEPKPALIGWAKKVTAEAAISEHALVGEIIAKSGEQAAIDHLKGSAWRTRDEAAAMGSQMHEVAELEIMGTGFPEPTESAPRSMLLHFRHFLKEQKPEWLAIEAVVVNSMHRYAGTLDAIGRFSLPELGDLPLLVDWKTGSGVYGSYALQLSAYSRATHVVGPQGLKDINDTPLADLNKEKAVVLHLRPMGWKLIEVSINDDVFEAFLTTRDMAAWTEASNSVVGATVAYGKAGGVAMALQAKKAEEEAPKPKIDASGFQSRRKIQPPKF